MVYRFYGLWYELPASFVEYWTIGRFHCILKVSSWIFNWKGLPAGQGVVRKMSHKSNEYNYYWLYNSQVSDMKPLDSDLVTETFFTLQFIFMCWPLGWFMFLIFDFVSYLFRESVSTRCKK